MNVLTVVILAVVQGLAELLPVSSSAHVVVAEKLLGLDPSSPPMTLVLVMLHTGTMFAVIAYFWRDWRKTYFESLATFVPFAIRVALATLTTGVIGYGIVQLIERTVLAGRPKAQIEDLFSHLEWIAPALGVAGLLILYAGLRTRREVHPSENLSHRQAAIVGAVQGLCLPFRGFSRSGATISTGMLLNLSRRRIESFSFALAVVLTPPVVMREAYRLIEASKLPSAPDLHVAVLYSLLGAVIAFGAGLVGLRWLSRWLETDRWYLFGVYCLAASGVVLWLHNAGY